MDKLCTIITLKKKSRCDFFFYCINKGQYLILFEPRNVDFLASLSSFSPPRRNAHISRLLGNPLEEFFFTLSVFLLEILFLTRTKAAF